MNAEKIYKAMLEDDHKEKVFETPEYNTMYGDFCKKYGEEKVGADLTDIAEYIQRNAFVVGFRAAMQLMLEGKGGTKPDMDKVCDEYEALLVDIEGELEGSRAIAEELWHDLGEEENSQYTNLCYALWSSLEHLAKDTSRQHNAICLLAHWKRTGVSK